MIFLPFLSPETGCAAYQFGCATLRSGCVVDPLATDVERYIELAEQKDLPIELVIDTHVHADHESGGRRLAERTGAKYCLHEAAEVSFVFEPLVDGQRLELGNTQITVLHTPGHTPESICLLVTDRRRGSEPWFLLTGDTLLVGAVGRPDLPGQARAMAGQLHDSLHDKILTLPDDMEVYPAHFAGSACGAGLSGKPTTTLGFERRHNPVLGLGRDAFIDAITAALPPPPSEVEHNLRFNRGLA